MMVQSKFPILNVAYKAKPFKVQSILFDKKLFTPKQAITWLKKHKYKYSKIDIKPNHLRFRQITPKKGDEYRTKKLGDSGIELILEMPKLKGGANNTEQIKLFNEILKHLIHHITSGEFDKLDIIQSKKLINEINKLKGGSFNDLSEDDRLRLYNDLLKYANPDDTKLEMLMKKYKENYTSNRIGSKNNTYHNDMRKSYFDEFKNITIPKIKEHHEKKSPVDKTINIINMLIDKLYTNRKEHFNTEYEREHYKIILDAVGGFDFFPTPPKYGEMIYDDIKKEWGDYPNTIMDMCCGLLSLSLPYIKNMKEDDKIYLIEFNKMFIPILKPIESNNIILDSGNVLNLTNEYYDKHIHYIVCNPPFSISFDFKGKHYSDYKLGYLFFLYKCCDILQHQYGEYLPTLYFICPTTLFKAHTRSGKHEVGEIAELKIPKTTLYMIEKYFNPNEDIDKDNEYPEWFSQAQYMADVSGFRGLAKNGKPRELKSTFGLFKIIVGTLQKPKILNEPYQAKPHKLLSKPKILNEPYQAEPDKLKSKSLILIEPEIKKSFNNPKLNEMYDKYLKITHSDDSHKVIMTKLKPIFNYIFDIKNITEEEQKLFKEMMNKDEEALNKTGKEQFKKYLDIPASQPFKIAMFNPKDKLNKEEFEIYIKLLNDYNKKYKEKGESVKINKINKFIKDKDINQLKKLSKEYLYEIFNNKDKPIEKYTKDKLIDEILKKNIPPTEKRPIPNKQQIKDDIEKLINDSHIPIKQYNNNDSINAIINKIDNILLSKKPAKTAFLHVEKPIIGKKPQVGQSPYTPKRAIGQSPYTPKKAIKINKSVLMRKLKPELIKMAKEQNKNLTDDLTKLKKDDIIDKYIINNPEDYKKDVEGYQIKAINRLINKLNKEGDDYLPYAQLQFSRRPKIFLETFQKLHPDLLKQIFSYNPDKLKIMLLELKEEKPKKEKKPKKESKSKKEKNPKKESKSKKDEKPKKESKSKKDVIDNLAIEILKNVDLTPFSVDFKGDSERTLSNTFSFDFDNIQKDEFSKKYEDLLLLLLKNVIPRYDIYEKYKLLL